MSETEELKKQIEFYKEKADKERKRFECLQKLYDDMVSNYQNELNFYHRNHPYLWMEYRNYLDENFEDSDNPSEV